MNRRGKNAENKNWERRSATSVQNGPLEAKKSHDSMGKKIKKNTSLERLITDIADQDQMRKDVEHTAGT